MIRYEKALPRSEGPRRGKRWLEAQEQAINPERNATVNGNIVVEGHRTSVRLEAEMWAALKDVARREGCSVNELAGRIHRRKKPAQNFTSAIRVFLMLYYRNAAKRAEHAKAGQGRERVFNK